MGAALAVQAFALSVFQVYDPDTWWHLKTGELIVTKHFIPTADLYSWVIQGKPWLAFEWLSQALFYLAYAAAGAAGLTSFKALVVAAAFFACWTLAGGPLAPGSAGTAGRPPRQAGDAFLGALVLGLAAILTRGSFFERPQIFDFLLVPVFVRLVERRPPDKSLYWKLPLLEALWVNLHGGAAVLGLGVVGLRALEAALFERKSLKFWAGAAGLTLAAMLVNPGGWSLFAHLAATLSFPGKELIQEWMPPPSFLNMYGVYFALGLAALSLRGREDFLLGALCLGLCFMATRALRHLALAVLMVSPLIARGLASLLRPSDGRAYGFEPRALTFLFLAACLAVFSRTYALRLLTYNTEVLGFGLHEEPAGAVDYLDRAGVKGRMFNEYGMGGYLIWKAWPKRLVFIDGRNVEYGPEFVRAAAGWSDEGGFAALDARYHFDYAVIRNGAAYTCWQLDHDPAWALAYWDDAALVYLKRSPENRALIERDGYRVLQPNHVSYGYLNAAVASGGRQALAEIERAIASSSQNLNARLMKAYLLAELGRRPEARDALEQAVKGYPYKPGPMLSLGWFHERGNELEAAAAAYAKAAELSRQTGDWRGRSAALNNWGSVELKLGRPEEAKKRFRESLRVNAGFGQARRNLERAEGVKGKAI